MWGRASPRVPAGRSPAVLLPRAALEAIFPSTSKSNTMCFPTRRTQAIRLASSVAAISAAADFKGSGFDPSHTDSITSPVTRPLSPRAIVSTSGSSGIDNSLQSLVISRQQAGGHPEARRRTRLPIPSPARYHEQYTPAPLISL